jgi:O-antigen/teichoic acid export membrane protein
LQGASLVALASICERGLLFLANVFSARVSGPENYGTYGLTLQTAGVLASHASLGIGLVATRFAAEYPLGHPQNRAFVRSILHLSFYLAVLSSVLMLALSWPLAYWFFGKPALVRVLQVALLTAPVFVLFEAIRGLLVGQTFYSGLIVLSAIFGVFMVFLLPLSAPKGPRWMLFTHAMCALVALLTVILIIIRRYHLTDLSFRRLPDTAEEHVPLARMLRFGMLQVGSGTAVNLIMIWLMALLVRYAPPEDLISSYIMPIGLVMLEGPAFVLSAGALFVSYFGLREVGYYNAASSLRNLSSLLPGLLLQVSYTLMTDRRSETYGGARRIVLVNTWLTSIFIIPIAGLGIAIMPWLLPFLFGKEFTEGVEPASYLLATAVVHTISQAAVNRLSIISLRTLAAVNLLWVLVAGIVGWFLVQSKGATGVAQSLLLAHCATMIVVPFTLQWLRGTSAWLWIVTGIGLAGALAPLFLSLFVQNHSDLFYWPRLAVVAVSGFLTLVLWLIRNPILDIRSYANS